MSCGEGRADPEMRSAKRITLCRALQSWLEALPYHTTLRCTESVDFLWPLNRKFSGFLVRSWISSAVADGTVFAFLTLCLDVCSPSQVLRDVYTEVLEAAHPLHRGPTDHKRSILKWVYTSILKCDFVKSLSNHSLISHPRSQYTDTKGI